MEKQESTEQIKKMNRRQKIMQKLKQWDWKTFLKTNLRNFVFLLIIFFSIYLMMNIFLELKRISQIFLVSNYIENFQNLRIIIGEKITLPTWLNKLYIQCFLFNQNFFPTIFLFFATYFILKSITGKSKIACMILLILELIYEVLNYLVINLRGEGIALTDIYSISTALNVIQGMKVQISGFFVAGIFLFMIAFLLILNLKIVEKKPKVGQRIVLFCLGCVLIGAVSNMGYVKSISIWDINFTYQGHGTPITIVKMLSNREVEKPFDYKEVEVKKLLANYQPEEAGKVSLTEDSPNIIVIMNESFADLYRSFGVGNQDPIPYFRRLIQNDNVISGTMYSSEIGGRTANVEYEFLTQNTTAFLPIGTVPYQQYSLKNRENLAQTLKSLGYQTSAIHSWYRSGYSRSKVYPILGFEKIAFYEDLPDLKKSFNGKQPTDQSTYQETIKMLEKKEKGTKLFNFTVTMQNHKPYIKDDPEQIKYSEDPEINCYLQSLHQSDQALAYLVEKLEEQEERVVLLFFGDHQPKLQNVESNLSSIKTYEVPYFIWANYEIEGEQGKDVSTNYLQNMLIEVAGLPKTNYTAYMEELQKTIPVITKQFYQDSTGTTYDITEQSSPDYAKIEEYKKVVYYQMFHK